MVVDTWCGPLSAHITSLKASLHPVVLRVGSVIQCNAALHSGFRPVMEWSQGRYPTDRVTGPEAWGFVQHHPLPSFHCVTCGVDHYAWTMDMTVHHADVADFHSRCFPVKD